MWWIKPLIYVVLFVGSIVLGLRIVDKQTGRLSTKMVHWLAAALFVFGWPLMDLFGAAGEPNAVLIAMAKSVVSGAALFGGWLLTRLLAVWIRAWSEWRSWFAVLVELSIWAVLAVSSLAVVRLAGEAATAQPGIASVLTALSVVAVWLLTVWSTSRWVVRRVALVRTGHHTDQPGSDIQPQGHAV